jgi:hypothetical protein
VGERRLIEAILDFIQRAWSEERAGLPGHINLALIAISAAVVAISLATEAIQAVVRIFKPQYSTGLPSLIVPLIILFVGGLVCVMLVGLLAILSDRDRRTL